MFEIATSIHQQRLVSNFKGRKAELASYFVLVISQTVSAKSISSVATSGFIIAEMTARKCGPGFESKLGIT